MTIPTTRKILSVSIRQDLYGALVSHCAKEDIPLSVFVRDAIKAQLLEDHEKQE